MNDDWGLTENGFHRPTYTTLLNALEYKARELYGDGINLTVRSPLGLFLRLLAWIWNILWSCLEDVYNSRFIDTAAGNSLFNLGRNIGLQVLSAGKARGYITVTGAPGTIVPAGYLVATNGGLQYTVTAEQTIPESGSVLVMIQAAEIGPEYNTDAGTVISIVNPFSVVGITSVTNDAAITGGRQKETQAEFRNRYYESVDYSGGVNADAIRASILNNVAGVTSVYIYENDTDVEDINNLPPHSIEAVVCGGLDEEIAKAIYGRKSGGIQTVGNVSVQVMSASEQPVAIHFSRPEEKKIYIRISNLETSTAYAGDAAVKKALIDYIGGDVSGGLGISADVVYIKLPGIVTALSGIEDFDLAIGVDGVSYNQENITIGPREKAMTDAGAITIILAE